MAVQGLLTGLRGACTQVLKSRLPNNAEYLKRMATERSMKQAARTIQRDVATIGKKLGQETATDTPVAGSLLENYVRYIWDIGKTRSPGEALGVVIEDLGLMLSKAAEHVRKFIDEMLNKTATGSTPS